MTSEKEKPSQSFPSQQNQFTVPSPPSYGELTNSTTGIFKCDICLQHHSTLAACSSKPPYAPDHYFRKCDICLGHHPRGSCYFENLRETLFTYSDCSNCKRTHIGFCNVELYCMKCDKRHNAADDCTVRAHYDLSNNLCPKCDGFHTNHCYNDLLLIETGLILWCNRCKVNHPFLKCVPFCNKCQRRHRLSATCPKTWDHCELCLYSHQGKSCPKADFNPNLPRISPPCATDCNKCCKPVHFKTDKRKSSPQAHVYETVFDEQVTDSARKKPTPAKTTRPFHKLREHQKGSALVPPTSTFQHIHQLFAPGSPSPITNTNIPYPPRPSKPPHPINSSSSHTTSYVEPYATSPSTTHTNSPAPPPNYDEISAATRRRMQLLPSKTNPN